MVREFEYKGETFRVTAHGIAGHEEIFIVQEGAAVFTIDDQTVEAPAGQIVVVPAGSAHGFRGASEVPLRQVSIHPAPEMETEWLE